MASLGLQSRRMAATLLLAAAVWLVHYTMSSSYNVVNEHYQLVQAATAAAAAQYYRYNSSAPRDPLSGFNLSWLIRLILWLAYFPLVGFFLSFFLVTLNAWFLRVLPWDTDHGDIVRHVEVLLSLGELFISWLGSIFPPIGIFVTRAYKGVCSAMSSRRAVVVDHLRRRKDHLMARADAEMSKISIQWELLEQHPRLIELGDFIDRFFRAAWVGICAMTVTAVVAYFYWTLSHLKQASPAVVGFGGQVLQIEVPYPINVAHEVALRKAIYVLTNTEGLQGEYWDTSISHEQSSRPAVTTVTGEPLTVTVTEKETATVTSTVKKSVTVTSTVKRSTTATVTVTSTVKESTTATLAVTVTSTQKQSSTVTSTVRKTVAKTVTARCTQDGVAGSRETVYVESVNLQNYVTSAAFLYLQQYTGGILTDVLSTASIHLSQLTITTPGVEKTVTVTEAVKETITESHTTYETLTSTTTADAPLPSTSIITSSTTVTAPPSGACAATTITVEQPATRAWVAPLVVTTTIDAPLPSTSIITSFTTATVQLPYTNMQYAPNTAQSYALASAIKVYADINREEEDVKLVYRPVAYNLRDTKGKSHYCSVCRLHHSHEIINIERAFVEKSKPIVPPLWSRKST